MELYYPQVRGKLANLCVRSPQDAGVVICKQRIVTLIKSKKARSPEFVTCITEILYSVLVGKPE
jgi:hypothetical protein